MWFSATLPAGSFCELKLGVVLKVAPWIPWLSSLKRPFLTQPAQRRCFHQVPWTVHCRVVCLLVQLPVCGLIWWRHILNGVMKMSRPSSEATDRQHSGLTVFTARNFICCKAELRSSHAGCKPGSLSSSWMLSTLAWDTGALALDQNIHKHHLVSNWTSLAFYTLHSEYWSVLIIHTKLPL